MSFPWYSSHVIRTAAALGHAKTNCITEVWYLYDSSAYQYAEKTLRVTGGTKRIRAWPSRRMLVDSRPKTFDANWNSVRAVLSDRKTCLGSYPSIRQPKKRSTVGRLRSSERGQLAFQPGRKESKHKMLGKPERCIRRGSLHPPLIR
jgi:hypothetical protein